MSEEQTKLNGTMKALERIARNMPHICAALSGMTGVAKAIEGLNRIAADRAILGVFAGAYARMQEIEALKAKAEPKQETWRDRPPML